MMRLCALMIALMAATIYSSTCPSAMPNTCIQSPQAANYAASNGQLTAAECCTQCEQDGELCYGWVWRPSKNDASKGSCIQYDTPLDRNTRYRGNCTTGTMTHRPAKACTQL